MTLLALEEFGGLAPKIHPRKLAETLATVAENNRLDRGVVEPWKGINFLENTTNGSLSLYPYQGNFLVSSFRRQYVDSLRPNDVRERIYYTDSDYPKIRSGAEEYRLGLPRPSVPATVTNDAGDKTNITNVFNASYVVTLVDVWGAEGPPSLPTASIELGSGHDVDVDLTPCTVVGDYNLGVGALFRIYRSNTGSESTLFQYVDEVPYGTATFNDTVAPADLQEALPSQNWNAAPDDDVALYPDGPLQSLIEMSGGILAGHTGNTVFLAEPYVPTAWPYYYSSELKVKAIAMIQGGIFCATEGRPFLLTGSHPAAMAMVPIESDQACVSPASMVAFGGYAIYASPDGLVLAEGNRAELITGEFFSKDEWAAYNPSSIHAYGYEGKYIGFYGDVTDGTGFIFDPRGGANTFITLSGLNVAGGYWDVEQDLLQVIYEEATQYKIGDFDTGSALQYTRRTKKFMFPDPLALNIVRIDADSYPITFELFADGVSKGSWSFTSDQPVKLPGGYRAREYQFEVRGTGAITGIYISDSMGEMV